MIATHKFTWLMLPVLVLCAAAAQADYVQKVLELKPVAYWRFEEGPAQSDRIADAAEMADAQTGEARGIAPEDVGQPGPRPENFMLGRTFQGLPATNRCCRFRGNEQGGDDVVVFADDGPLDFSASWNFSAAFWVKLAGEQEQGAGILAEGPGRGGEQFALDMFDGKLRFYCRDENNQAFHCMTGKTLADDMWHHVVAVCETDTGRMRVWVDGERAASASAKETLVIGEGVPVAVGSRQSGSKPDSPYDANFDGWIDEVALWNRALSDVEALQLFLAAFGDDPPKVTQGPVQPPAELLQLAQEKKGWRQLFTEGLEDVVDRGEWTVENGEIIAPEKGGNLWTQEKFGDFILSLKFMTVWDTNSGVLLRCSDLNDWINTTIEVQILQPNRAYELGTYHCGGIFDCLAPWSQQIKEVGQWNEYLIIARDNMIYVRLNGVWVASMDLSQWDTARQNPDGTPNKFRYALRDIPRRGHLGVQDHGQAVRFRNVRIKSLD